MTADNRTNEPTEAMIEAAAKIIRRESATIMSDPGDFWSDCYESEQDEWRSVARAALVAAQGAAPQAECSERPGGRPCEASKPGHKLHWSNGPKEDQGNEKLIADARALSEYLSEHIPGSRYKPMIDRLANALEAAPVLPSSGVDEDKLAEVLRSYLPMGEEPALDATAKAQARAVAEWLEGQGNAARE